MIGFGSYKMFVSHLISFQKWLIDDWCVLFCKANAITICDSASLSEPRISLHFLHRSHRMDYCATGTIENQSLRGLRILYDGSAKDLFHADYTVGWICTLPLEMAAAKLSLDRVHSSLPQLKVTRIHILWEKFPTTMWWSHATIRCLRTTSATVVAQQMLTTFSNIHFSLMVGIGGGVPNLPPIFDLGMWWSASRWTSIAGWYNTTLARLWKMDFSTGLGCWTSATNPFDCDGQCGIKPFIQTLRMSEILQTLTEKNNTSTSLFAIQSWARPAFDSQYEHEESAAGCDNCDTATWYANQRTSNSPCVHYGLIASGNQVMKHGLTRDRLAKALGIICFEMEAQG